MAASEEPTECASQQPCSVLSACFLIMANPLSRAVFAYISAFFNPAAVLFQWVVGNISG